MPQRKFDSSHTSLYKITAPGIDSEGWHSGGKSLCDKRKRETAADWSFERKNNEIRDLLFVLFCIQADNCPETNQPHLPASPTERPLPQIPVACALVWAILDSEPGHQPTHHTMLARLFSISPFGAEPMAPRSSFVDSILLQPSSIRYFFSLASFTWTSGLWHGFWAGQSPSLLAQHLVEMGSSFTFTQVREADWQNR